MVSIGRPVEELLQSPTEPSNADYSVEFCGGTHLADTSGATRGFTGTLLRSTDVPNYQLETAQQQSLHSSPPFRAHMRPQKRKAFALLSGEGIAKGILCVADRPLMWLAAQRRRPLRCSARRALRRASGVWSRSRRARRRRPLRPASCSRNALS